MAGASSGKGQDGGGRKMGGCDAHHFEKMKPQGKNAVTPGQWSRNNMSKGGVNKDMGSGSQSKKK